MKNWFRDHLKLVIVSIFIYVLLMLSLTYPMPYELYLPGGVSNVDNIIKFESSYKSSGSFNSSYVSVITKPSLVQYLYAKINDKTEINELTKQQNIISVKEINDSDRISKIQSINTSLIVAYNKAGREISYEPYGVIIAYRFPEFLAFDKLRVGDLITKINNNTVNSVNELSNTLSSIGCETSFNLTVIRDDNEKNLVVKQTEKNGYCRLGISVYNNYINFHGTPSFEIVDNSGYGSSAGLIQTLSIYNSITPIDITYNLKIAGTGVIDMNGNVLPIAGIKQKVFGACKAKVDIFFAPDMEDGEGNNLYQEALIAKSIMKSDIKIVPVKTFDDALSYLMENYGNK